MLLAGTLVSMPSGRYLKLSAVQGILGLTKVVVVKFSVATQQYRTLPANLC
jgi:hypothetical protein